MEYLIYLLPVIIGIIYALINKPAVNNSVSKFEDWLFYCKQKITPYSSKLNRFLTRPFLWLALKIKDWTNNISHSGIKSGIRITLYLYLGGLFLYLFVTFVILVVIFVMIGIVFWIYDKFTSDGSPAPKTYKRSTIPDRNMSNYTGFKGKNIYSGTNWFNEELKGRVDNQGNIYKGTNWFNEDKIGRIDNDGNILKGTSFFNETKIGRIDKEGNIQKGTNWFNEEKTGRIDKNGNVYKGSNWFSEEKQGRTGK
jgi:hypothetical protein